MNWYKNQLKNRIQNDKDGFSSAFCELSSIIMGEAAAKAGLVTPQQKTRNVIQEILKYYGHDIVPVPDSITDRREYYEYCLRSSGIMKRRVSLTGKWWRDASGPMAGTLKNGDAVALLPSRKGYSYYDYESGRRVYVNADTAKNIQARGMCFYKPLPNRRLSVLPLST